MSAEIVSGGSASAKGVSAGVRHWQEWSQEEQHQQRYGIGRSRVRRSGNCSGSVSRGTASDRSGVRRGGVS